MKKHLATMAMYLSLIFISAAPAAEPGSFGHLKQQWSKTMKYLGAFTAAQRDEAVDSTRDAIELLDREIEAFENEAQVNWHQLSASARASRRATLRELRRHRNNLSEWYGSMKNGSEETWEDSKDAFVSSYNDAANSLQGGIEAIKLEQN